jgi:hypothetical protein
MKSLHGVLHGGLWIRFQVSRNVCHAHLNASCNFREAMNFLIFFQQDGFQDILHGRFKNKQTPPSTSLKSIEFEAHNIKPNPPLFFRQHNMQWSRNMVHSHFTLCLRAREYIKWLFQHPWYGLWMRVKGPHHYKVTAPGSCVKYPYYCECILYFYPQCITSEAFVVGHTSSIGWKIVFI